MLVLLERGIFYGEKDIYDIYCWSGYFTFIFYYTTKAYTRDIIFYLNDSLAGNTFFHWLNLFDIIPSYNGSQQWKSFWQEDGCLLAFIRVSYLIEDL